ncbi:sulfatase-like hydrolase/transferase [Paenibacillus sp. KQZ6P-2]|uniref:Sulfatase-like hydrolase/transferase n=1 Tax=Paenibacillus mangrovi TaxID=2931978 RepID=A0A9X2B5G9_9BACL|nr:sulfatase-like hydrolase/transferase [Paenibacillus mangrovi]MCJ8012677.1 sulfatase-like hydrolase/transferase [Paenibacillus mangrovi]
MKFTKCFFLFFCLIIFGGFAGDVMAEGSCSSKIAAINSNEISIDTSYKKKIDNSVELKLINTGEKVWSKDKIRLSYHLMDRNNEIILNDGVRTPLPKDIKPGEYVIVIPNIEIPSDINLLHKELYIQFDLVEEGVQWFSELNTENSLVVPIKFIKNYDFEIVKPIKDISVWGKEPKQVKIRIKNTGSARWETYSGISFSYDLLDKEKKVVVHDGFRSALPNSVGPGEEVDLNVNINFPGHTGDYTIQWDMVNEGVGWFGNGEIIPDKQTDITFHSKLWLYLFYFLAAVLIVYFINLFITYFKTKKWEFRKSLSLMNHFYIRNIDIIWVTLSLYLKVKWSTLEICGNINTNIFIFLGAILTGLVINCFTNYKVRAFVSVLINCLVSLLLFSDLVYYLYFNDVITTGTIFNASQLTDVTDSISSLINYKYVVYMFSDIILMIIVCIVVNAIFHKERILKKSRVLYSLIGIMVVIGISGLVFSNLAKEDLFEKKYQNKLIAQDIGLANFHLYDFTTYMIQKFSNISPTEYAKINEWKLKKNSDQYDQYFGIARNKNVILIQSEALQSFVINLSYNNQVITPNLNKFAQNNLYFNNFYDQTGPGRTSDAEFMSLNSMFGLQSGSVYTTYNHNQFDSLPKILNDNGYSTMSAHGYNGSFWNRREMHALQGFQKSLFEENLVMEEKIGWGLSDRTFFLQSVDQIKKLPEPYFSFLITLSNHHPYNEVLPNSLNLGELEGTVVGNYLNSVHYADFAFGELINELNKSGILENTVIALYGDHDAGISLEELSTILDIKDTPEQQLSIDKVPFILHIPGINSGQIIETNTGHLDITPTLLHILGINHSNNVFLGENMFSKTSPVIFRNGNFIGKDFVSNDGVCQRNNAQNQCESIASEVNEKIWTSDTILRYNLTKKLLNTN